MPMHPRPSAETAGPLGAEFALMHRGLAFQNARELVEERLRRTVERVFEPAPQQAAVAFGQHRIEPQRQNVSLPSLSR